MKTVEEIIEDFSYLEEWEDKYGYLIELGNSTPLVAPEEKTQQNKVPGCMSQVWVIKDRQGDKYHFRATSDASIVRGLAAIIISMFSGKTREEILALPVEEYFNKMHVMEHISPNRRNGLVSMIDVIKLKTQED